MPLLFIYFDRIHLQQEFNYNLLHGVEEGATDHSDLMLAAAQAKRKVCKAEKHLADCILEHQVTLLDIWRHRAQAANSRLLTTDLNVGHIHLERKKNGIATFTHSEPTMVSLYSLCLLQFIIIEIVTDIM